MSHLREWLADLFDRPNKPGARTFSIHHTVEQPFALEHFAQPDQANVARAVIACTYSRDIGNDPHVLFHEFGHALHIVLSRTQLQLYAGGRGSRDFSEVPSTLFECFLSDYRVVSHFARNPANGSTLSEYDFAQWLLTSRKPLVALDTHHQIQLSIIDLVCSMTIVAPGSSRAHRRLSSW